MRRGARRDWTKERYWRRIVRKQAGSGMSARAWCRRHGEREPAFYWWRRELVRRAAARGLAPRVAPRATAAAGTVAAGSMFVPVAVTHDEASRRAARIEIVLANRRRIRLQGGVDRQALLDVLAVLEERSDAPSPRGRSPSRTDRTTQTQGLSLAGPRALAGATRKARPC